MAEAKNIGDKYGIFNDDSGKPYVLFKKNWIGRGGEANVFKYRKDKAVKIFKEQDAEKEIKLRLLLPLELDRAFCKPEKLLYRKDSGIAGYVMPFKTGKTLAESIFQPMEFTRLYPRWTRLELVDMALRFLEAISDLHSKGILIGDLNSSNILIGATPEDVTFIDMDSFQVGDYACKVGNVAFISPRLQGKKLALRTLDDELFAIATLLFMIFLLGKPPYRNEGNNLGDNIRNLAFTFPFEEGEQASVVAPAGIWERIWNVLPYDIRKAFYRTFKNGESVSVEEWMSLFRTYKADMAVNRYQRDIFPKEKGMVTRSTSMNKRDITDQDVALRNPLTILDDQNQKIGVLELSTKAVKLLVSKDDEAIRQHKFSFDAFVRFAVKTNTGRGLDLSNRMNMGYFGTRVLPVIRDFKKRAIGLGVGKLYTVATAAYRNAENREEIISLIREQTGINVCILKKKEEAAATINAYQFTTKNHEKLTASPSVVVIDQGGGSTEVSLYEHFDLLGSHSINLGTEVLRNYMYKRNGDTSLNAAIEDTNRVIVDRLKHFYRSSVGQYLQNHPPESIYCVALGTAVTNATGKKRNAEQHDMVLSRERIKEIIRERHRKLITSFPTVSDLYQKTEVRASFDDTIDSDLTVDLGLRMYHQLLMDLKIDSVTVSGTGLWYGVFFHYVGL